VIIAHGRSNARAIKNAVRVAAESADAGLVEVIKQGVQARKKAQDGAVREESQA